MSDKFYYSNKYFDTSYEYRHVHIPKTKKVDKLLSEKEWRKLGVQQSEGWEHYLIHHPEPNVLLFRRKLVEEK